MKITKEQLKKIVRETLTEESEYQTFFKKIRKDGKSIPQMSDDEKKSFFNKIEKHGKVEEKRKTKETLLFFVKHKPKKDGKDSFEVDGKKYKTERFGRGHDSTFGSEEVDEMVSSSEIGKGDNKKPSKDASDSSKINEGPSTEEKRIANVGC